MKNKKIKILQGIRQGKVGGGESYLMGLVENLDHRRFQPVVLSFTEGPMVDRLRSLGIDTHVIYTEKPFDFGVWGKVAELIKEENIDLVHAHGTRAMSNMFRPALKSNLPLIYTCHGWSFHRDQNPLVKTMRIQSEKFLTKKASVNICGAKANAEQARRLFGRFDAEIIYNSIDPSRFDPHNKYTDVRKELGLSEDEIIIASIARFTVQKQPLKLIAAFAEVAKQVPNATLLMVGDGEEKTRMQELIADMGLQTRVVMQPFRQDVPDVLAAADIFVLPSLWEVFPLALLEAMSMGKAAIATAVDGTPEMVQDGYNGLLINVDNLQEELQQAMLRLCNDDMLRQMISANAITSIYNKYNIRTLVEKNEAVYEKLMRVPVKSHLKIVLA